MAKIVDIDPLVLSSTSDLPGLLKIILCCNWRNASGRARGNNIKYLDTIIHLELLKNELGSGVQVFFCHQSGHPTTNLLPSVYKVSCRPLSNN